MKFKNGDLVDIEEGLGLSKFNPWTVLDFEDNLLGNKSFHGHYGNEVLRNSEWDGHCWYIDNNRWKPCVMSLENE